MSEKIDYNNFDYYTNRELSWLDFNDRVLEEARDEANPFLERLSFLSITQSNLDEFFMVRVASLAKLAAVNYPEPEASGMTAEEQLKAVNQKAHVQLTKQYQTLDNLLPDCERLGIHLKTVKQLTDKQYQYIKNYFHDDLYPVLTPMADDSSRPFPFIANDTLNLAIQLKKGGNDEPLYATLQIPDVFPRVLRLPDDDNAFILIEDVVKEFVSQLFVNYKIKSSSAFRVIRDMDLDVAEEDTSDLLKEVQQQLKLREHGDVIRLEVESSISKKLLKRLTTELNVEPFAIYEVQGPLDLTFLKHVVKETNGHDDLKYPKYKAYQPKALSAQSNIFDAISQHDWLMQHPYDKFDPVVESIRQASSDPDTLAIKMTLYRVSGDSPIIRYLGQAAQNGKQVTVLVEVKARFDEQNNVHWAKKLETMGCHVIYGLIGLKTHCKLSLVVRREENGIRRYMHMGTGNYNDATAHFYTDMGLFTANNDMGIDATNIFNMLSGYSRPPFFHELHISPEGIRDFIDEKLDAAIQVVKDGGTAHVQMKMNSLSDQEIIAHLYRASHAGVEIDIIVRGICCLRTGIKDVSDNITVHSIVGRFLEHSRIYIFDFNGEQTVFLSSADMMTRNLNRRVELLFPVKQSDLRDRVLAIYDIMWTDNVKTRVLAADNTYKRVSRGGKPANESQAVFVADAEKKVAFAQARAEQNKLSSLQSAGERQPETPDQSDSANPDGSDA
ncbi:RNA degradosome polyphosphate kinase [Secundilactobacillus collinoides]|uniref:Polyphosphate kinase n=1 Tax=Secundilactobacillus collinoides DSM 20515 = JCM 1123 TaxID=1423733 RepID=A0A0R2B8W8_SECCO|nr:RNA degradosome polyphosphate kinase [Secundilactobacillus collinoides]KRM75269.1 polyphosphate kinase [Secundilactobacillus collinoides DSM 20515 = JCM 1123]